MFFKILSMVYKTKTNFRCDWVPAEASGWPLVLQRLPGWSRLQVSSTLPLFTIGLNPPFSVGLNHWQCEISN